MGTPPDALLRLVDRFSLGHKVFLSGDYEEERLRAEFLNPFFAALGRDMDNTIDTIQDRNWELSLFVRVPKLGFAYMYAGEQRKAEAS